MNDALDRLMLALPDRYIVEAEIGREGLDVRYRARDRQLDQLVTIRALRPELADSGVGPFFLRECDLLNRLDHPQIVCVHEVAEAANVCYMVTEHLHGETLQERLTCEGQIPIVDAVEIASDLAEGLSHAHARSDVYSLGTVVYEMLTGELPFDGARMRAIVEQILHGPPLSFTGIRPAVPECLQQVVKTATARKPEERYQTAEEFRAALAGSLDESGRPPRKAWWRLPWL